LNLALALLHRPRAVFLDEPTAGVDPQSRAFILDVVRGLAAAGTTVVYTSHYMDEVQQVCRRVAILDHGKVLAQGGLPELLQADRALHLTLGAAPPAAFAAELRQAQPAAVLDGAALSLPAADAAAAVAALQPLLARHGTQILSLRYGDGDLETLFLRLTHRRLRD
jgi:ABC-2 type transport system ATP-binding protein